MEESTISKVVSLAHSLKKSADVLLDKNGHLSLDTWTLYEIEEAFSLILQVEQHTTFHVLPENYSAHPAIPTLQFVYDLFQRIEKIHIWTKPGQPLPPEQTISLRCMRNLQVLELYHVPVLQIRGLQNLRPTLKSLAVSGITTDLESILLQCGADQSCEYMWEKLKRVIFPHNSFGKLDSSLRLLPYIKELDLSYCQLTNVDAIFCLPSVTHCNLCFNKITKVPPFSQSSSLSLVSLNLNNNLITELKGLHCLFNLEELDIGFNLLSFNGVLNPLLELVHLKSLNLVGNPIYFNLNHRSEVFKYLHPATSLCQFQLNSIFLNGEEAKEVKKSKSAPPSSTPLSEELLESFSSAIAATPRLKDRRNTELRNSGLVHSIQAVEVHAAEFSSSPRFNESHSSNRNRRSRRKRVRQVAILDPEDNDKEKEIAPLKASIEEDLTPLAIPDLSSSLKASTSLDSQTQTSISNFHKVPSQADKLLEEILNATDTDFLLGEEKISTPPDERKKSVDATVISSMVSSTNSSFFKTEERPNEGCSRQSSEEFAAIQSDNEDIDSCLLMVLARRVDEEDERDDLKEKNLSTDVILHITKDFFKEKAVLSNETLIEWPNSCVEDLEVISEDPPVIRLDFESTEKYFTTRTYLLTEEFEKLKLVLNNILEEKASKSIMDDVNLCPNCECSMQISDAFCLTCDSGASAVISPIINTTMRQDTKGHNPKSSSLSQEVSKSDNSESVGSWRESSNESKKGSDIELMSSPSLSSIEILHDHINGVTYQDPLNEEENVQMSDDVPISGSHVSDVGALPDILKVGGPLTGTTLMQESSSSGSMAGSVCTAVEQIYTPSLALLSIEKGDGQSVTPSASDSKLDENDKTSLDECTLEGLVIVNDLSEVPNLFLWLKNIIASFTGYEWDWWDELVPDPEIKALDRNLQPIIYSYEDCTTVDHRLKLYAEVFLFKEQEEMLSGLIKGVLCLEGLEPFTGFVIISSSRFYVLEIISLENDFPQNWLREIYSCNTIEVTHICKLLQNQGLCLKTAEEQTILICFADSERCSSVYTFLTDVLENRIHEEWSCEQNNFFSNAVSEFSSPKSSLTDISIFMVITLLEENGSCSNHFFVANETNLLLLEANLHLYSTKDVNSSNDDLHLSCTKKEGMIDVCAIKIFTNSIIAIEFQHEEDDSRSVWLMHLTSLNAVILLLTFIRSEWFKLFGVYLEVKCYAPSLSLKQKLKEL